MEEASGFPANPGGEAGDRMNEEPEKGEEGDRSSNRWPRHETLALLRLRSEMDAAFKDTNVKVPLWEEVSRKLGELGYRRSAKKCKEKFENIYKYHRRTKEGRSGKQNGKNYRFFAQLEALDSNGLFMSSALLDKVKTPVGAAVENPLNVGLDAVPISAGLRASMLSVESTSISQSSFSSDESEGMSRRKRKLKEFVESLMLEVIQKQESLQQRFLEALEKCERDRMAREEAWKMQELERIRRERELLAHERSVAAAKDAAVLSFLQKFSGEASSVQLPEHLTVPMQFSENRGVQVDKVVNTPGGFGVEGSHLSSSRWPKEEIETLIRLRTNLDVRYQDNSSKGPLWEEISAEMKKLGYDRSAKRCKEKWENMNKYFKRVKESNKRRPGDSRTCPYFNQLDALYKDKVQKVDNELKPEELLMQMMGGQGEERQPESATTEDGESENMYPNQEESRETEDGDGFPAVASDPSSMAFMQC